MKALTLEPLTESHLPEILELERACNPAPWSERSFRHELDHAFSIFRVAKLGQRVVGYAGVWLVVDEAHVTTVAVAPDQRRKGIGRTLTIEILTEAKRKGMACVTLEVRASNEAAIKLYESLGFERAALRKRYYPDNQEDAVVMWLYDLETWAPA